jgi:hypothetical protein
MGISITRASPLAAPAEHLIAHWRFDETIGAIASDSTGWYPASLSAQGARFSPGGVAGNAVELNASAGGHLRTGTSLPALQSAYSLSAWIRVAAGEVPLDSGVFSRHVPGYENGFYLALNHNINNYRYSVGGYSGGPSFLVTDDPVADSEWHHLVVTYAEGDYRLYIDGVQKAAVTTGPILSSSAEFVLGGFDHVGSIAGNFNGSLDDVQVYDFAISPEQVSQLFSQAGESLEGVSPPPRLPPSISAHPLSQTLVVGGNAAFSVTASGTEPLSYGWLFNGSLVPFETSRVLNRIRVRPAFAGSYQAIVTNSAGSATSHVAILEVTEGAAPQITPAGGTFQGPVTVTVSTSVQGAQIHLTLDGSEPSAGSQQYLGSLRLERSGTLRAAAFYGAERVTAISRTEFVINNDGPFERITTGPIATDTGHAIAATWADYDSDGDLDLFVTHLGRENALYRNDGAGNFTRIHGLPPVNGIGEHLAAGWGDYDNDGRLDLFVNNYSRGAEVYRNLGEGGFDPPMVLAAPGTPASVQPGAWADFDGDGLLDLFAGQHGTAGNLLFRQAAPGKFELQSHGPVTGSRGFSLGAGWADYDGDLRPDLFVANGANDRDWLFRNAGNGGFALISNEPFAWENGGSVGLSWGDYDNDGDPDLFVAVGGNQRSVLYRNDGVAGFVTVPDAAPARDVVIATSAMWGDYDNDGWLDLHVTCRTQPNLLYRNLGNGSFARVMEGPAVTDTSDSNGCAWGDYDGDGFLDLIVANWNGQTSDLYRNKGNANAWLKVRCVGRASNRSSLGARVTISTTRSGRMLQQMREINTGDGWGSPELIAHFGLGDATMVDSVRVEWPSGRTLEVTKVSGRQTLNLEEPGPAAAPGIISHPTDQSVSFGSTVRLEVIARGHEPLSYQWYFNHQAIPGAIESHLELAGITRRQAGTYHVVVRNEGGSVQSQPAVITVIGGPEIRFTRRNEPAIDSLPSSALGAAWGDFDGDSRLDLAFSLLDGNPAILLRHTPLGFERVTSEPIDADTSSTVGVSWADYDGDGDLDLLRASYYDQHESLYRNHGNGTFARIDAGPVVTSGGSSQAGLWMDYSGDGLLDLVVINGGGAFHQPNFLFRGTGAGEFVRVTDTPITRDARRWQGGAWGDFDNDGAVDLFVSDSDGQNSLFRNLRNGSFEHVHAEQLNTSALGTGSSSGAWGDFDNDGDLDLVMAVSASPICQLFRNDHGLFTRITPASLADTSGASFSAAWADFNNDGWLDLVIANRDGRTHLFHGLGGGDFLPAPGEAIPNAHPNSNAIAIADYDNDGDLDLLLTSWPAAGPALYQNETLGNHWLRVSLHGTRSNRNGLGAKVRVQARLADAPVWQMRQVGGENNSGSHETTAHFGLGSATIAEVVRVEWPSGVIQELPNVAAGQVLVVSEPAEESAAFAFTRVDAGPLTEVREHAYSAAWGDYDGDQRPDVYLATLFQAPAAFFRNGADAFVRISSSPVGEGSASRAGAVWTDTDNDGDLDLFVATSLGESGLYYVNHGNGTFAAVLDDPAVTSGGFGQSVLAADFDRDGAVDLFVPNGGGWRPEANFLFHNRGAGRFERVLSGPVAEEILQSSGAAAADFDGDQNIDLFVANIGAPNSLFRNTGNGTFVKVLDGPVAMESETIGAGSAAWGDYDNDGDFDLLVTHGSPVNHLYRNDGGQFTKVTDSPIAAEGGTCVGAVFADLDNDGWLDVLIAGRTTPNLVYRGTPDGRFEAITRGPLVDHQQGGNGIAMADYDQDGDLDVLFTNWEGNGSPALYRNDQRLNGWLQVQLRGTASNRFGVGARVRIKTIIHGRPMWLVRQIGGEDSQGSHESIAHFGLGDAPVVEAIRVEWPSGHVQELNQPFAPRQRIEIVEDASGEVAARMELVQPAPAREGTRAILPIRLSSEGQVSGGTLLIRYYPEALADEEIVWAPFFSDAFKEANLTTQGEIRLVFAMPLSTVPAGDQIIAELQGRARSVPADTTHAIALEVADLSDINGNPLRRIASIGTNLDVLRRVFIGDNNGNERHDIGDAIVILRFLGLFEPTQPWDVTGNDLNQSGTLDSGDVIRVLRSAVGLGTASPVLASNRRRTTATLSAAETGRFATLLPDPAAVVPGETLRVGVELSQGTGRLSGAAFALHYPVEALRLRDLQSVQSGPIVPGSAMAYWNVVPDNRLTTQDGTVRFAASSAEAWAATSGILAELEFEVQPGAGARREWTLQLEQIEVTDDGYEIRSGAPVEIRIAGREPVRATLAGLTRNSDQSWTVQMTGEPGRRYHIEISEDLVSWTLLNTATTAPDGTLSFSDPEIGAASSHRFYRAIEAQ